MANKVDYKWNAELFKQMVDFVDTTKVVKVGILSNPVVQVDGDSSSGVGIATIASVHEFGSAKINVPERSFLRRTYLNRIDDFKAFVSANKKALLDKLQKEGEMSLFSFFGSWWVTAVQDTFENQGPDWQPLSKKYAAWKKKYKKSSKILITDGTLRDSVTFEVNDET